jgi:hypothetical protein
MASTRMRVSQSTQVFHRVAAAGDMAVHDVATTDTIAQGMGGTADFELESDETVVHVDASAVFDASESAIGSAAIADYIYIKNTGFTTSARTTATASTLTVGVGGAFASGGFTLSAGEAITMHGLGGGSDNLSEFQLDSSSGDIYVEVKYL